MALKKYIKMFFSFSLGTWLTALISFFTTPLITYLIIPDEFGKASIYTLVYNIALIIALMGLDQSYIRFYYNIFETNRNKSFWLVLIPSLAFGFTISLIFLIFEKNISYFLFSKEYKKIGILFLINLITGILQRFNELSIRMQKKGLSYSATQVLKSLGNTFGIIIYSLIVNSNFFAIIFGQILGNISAILYGFISDGSSRKIQKIGKKDLHILKKYFKYGIPLFPAILINWFFASIDKISLRQYTNFTEIGLYSAAFKIISAMNLIQAGFSNFWLPVAYEKYEKNKNNVVFFRTANLIVSFLMFSFGLLLLGFKDIIFTILEKSYREAAYIAPFLILTPIMFTISETTVLGINFKKKTYFHIIIMLISTLVNYLGNTILVPLLGAKGAAISTGLSYIVFFLLRTIIAEKIYHIGFKLNKIIFGIIITVISAYIGTFFRNITLNVITALLGIILISLIYRNEIKLLIKNNLKR